MAPWLDTLARGRGGGSGHGTMERGNVEETEAWRDQGTRMPMCTHDDGVRRGIGVVLYGDGQAQRRNDADDDRGGA